MSTIKTELITNYLAEKKLSKAAFCKLCKISPSVLNKILSNNKKFRIGALYKIAKVLGKKIVD